MANDDFFFTNIECSQLPVKFKIKVRVLGDRSLIPADILEIVVRLEKMTEDYDGGLLNICFPYTSRNDIKQAMVRIAHKVEKKELQVGDVDVKALEEEMYTGGSPKLDLMIRTSGATRFSDFMIWQSCDNCQVEFIDTLWPAFTKLEMIKILTKWGFSETRRLRAEEVVQSKRHIFSKKSVVRKAPIVSVTEVERAAQVSQEA